MIIVILNRAKGKKGLKVNPLFCFASAGMATKEKCKYWCLLRSSVSVWVSVWVIWRITNRHSVKYAELRIGILLKVCRFLIRHTLPNADVISSYHAVKYAELRIGILLEYCRFLNRHTLKVCRFLIRHTMR